MMFFRNTLLRKNLKLLGVNCHKLKTWNIVHLLENLSYPRGTPASARMYVQCVPRRYRLCGIYGDDDNWIE